MALLITGGLLVAMGYVLGRLHEGTQTTSAVITQGRTTIGRTFPSPIRAEFITPSRVEEILKGKPSASIDDVLK